jgi:hypothetical protein
MIYRATKSITELSNSPDGTIESMFKRGLYILLNPEDDTPQYYEGKVALQHNGNVVCDGLDLEHARAITLAVNSHYDLVEALEFIRKELSQHVDRYSGNNPVMYAYRKAEDAIAKAKNKGVIE